MLECAKALKKKGDVIAEIRFFDEINANASGGTLDTVFHALGSRSMFLVHDLCGWLGSARDDYSLSLSLLCAEWRTRASWASTRC